MPLVAQIHGRKRRAVAEPFMLTGRGQLSPPSKESRRTVFSLPPPVLSVQATNTWRASPSSTAPCGLASAGFVQRSNPGIGELAPFTPAMVVSKFTLVVIAVGCHLLLVGAAAVAASCGTKDGVTDEGKRLAAICGASNAVRAAGHWKTDC